MRPGLAIAETRYGFHVIRLDQHAPGQVLPFELARDRIAIISRPACSTGFGAIYRCWRSGRDIGCHVRRGGVALAVRLKMQLGDIIRSFSEDASANRRCSPARIVCSPASATPLDMRKPWANTLPAPSGVYILPAASWLGLMNVVERTDVGTGCLVTWSTGR
jgi:hypothetical protein